MLLLIGLFGAVDPAQVELSCMESSGPELCLEGGLELAYGDTRDEARAQKLLGLACKRGSQQACFHERLVRLGAGMELNLEANEAGQNALRDLCVEDHSRACYHLGVFHTSGPVAWRDMSQASMSFRQACDGGVPEGCFYLAEEQAGSGTEAGNNGAKDLYRKGCDAGHPASCRELGRLSGDPAMLARACESGDVQACALKGP